MRRKSRSSQKKNLNKYAPSDVRSPGVFSTFPDGVSVDSAYDQINELHTPSAEKLLRRFSAPGTDDWGQHSTTASSRPLKSGGQVDNLFRHKVQAIVNPLHFLLKDQPKLRDAVSPFAGHEETLTDLSPEW